jgi:hypothetical protein
MQNDLQYGFFVLCLLYLCNCTLRSMKGLFASRWGLETSPQRHWEANKPFFMLVRNVSMEVMDG